MTRARLRTVGIYSGNEQKCDGSKRLRGGVIEPKAVERLARLRTPLADSQNTTGDPVAYSPRHSWLRRRIRARSSGVAQPAGFSGVSWLEDAVVAWEPVRGSVGWLADVTLAWVPA